MAYESLVTWGFEEVISRLGGRAYIEKSARETRAFLRAQGIEDAFVLLRLILAYCLGGKGLRLTAASAASLGVADIYNVVLPYRLKQSGDWLSVLAGPFRCLPQGSPRPDRSHRGCGSGSKGQGRQRLMAASLCFRFALGTL
jgi:hypothetical protein